MNILVVEDEPKTAKLLKEMIESQDEANTVLAICDSIESTIHFIGKCQVNIDLFFMDIMLADGNSFDIFSHIKIKAPVVFCTAYENHIMAAFKNNGIDYIVKPFQEKDIENAFTKIKQLKQSLAIGNNAAKQILDSLKPPAVKQASFLVQFRGKMYPVQVKDIAMVALENEVVYLYTFNNEKHPVFKPIDDIESVLEPQKFYRINRQMLVNREAIVEIEPFFNRKVLIKTNINPHDKPVVSRLKVTPFLEWVERG